MARLIRTYSSVMRRRNALRYRYALACFLCAVMCCSCSNSEPPRDEIPHIKDQLAKLESLYGGAYHGSLDSLLTTEFAATGGDQGVWQAKTIENSAWTFSGSKGRSFFYNKESGEADLQFVYHSPDQLRDTAFAVKITFKKNKDRWLVSGVKPVEPLTY